MNTLMYVVCSGMIATVIWLRLSVEDLFSESYYE